MLALYKITVYEEKGETTTWEWHKRHEAAYEATKNRVGSIPTIHVRMASGLEVKIVKAGYTPQGDNKAMWQFAQEKELI